MENSIFLSEIDSISNTDKANKLSNIQSYCASFLLKNHGKYNVYTIENNVYTNDPKKLSSKLIHELYVKFKAPLSVKPQCGQKHYTLYFELYELYSFYKSKTFKNIKAFTPDLYYAYIFEKLSTVENIDYYDEYYSKLLLTQNICHTKSYFPPYIKDPINLDVVYAGINICISNNFSEVKLYAKKNNIKTKVEKAYFLNDLRLKRIKLLTEKPIYFYNYGEYSLVSYFNLGKAKIGTVFVCYRFQFINNILNNIFSEKQSFPEFPKPYLKYEDNCIYPNIEHFYGRVIDIKTYYKNECEREYSYNPRIMGHLAYNKNKN